MKQERFEEERRLVVKVFERDYSIRFPLEWRPVKEFREVEQGGAYAVLENGSVMRFENLKSLSYVEREVAEIPLSKWRHDKLEKYR